MSGNNGASRPKISFFASEETEVFDLGDGYWVELKRDLDYGEESELEGAAIKAGLDPTGQPRMEFSLKQQRALMLALYIVDWNIPDVNGKTVRLPPSVARRVEIVGHLSTPVARRIATRIEAIRRGVGAAEAVSLEGVEGAEENPTLPGNGSGSETPSSSAGGGVDSGTTMSSGALTASSWNPSV